MPRDLLLRVNWDLVYPSFRDRCFTLVANCRERRKADYFAVSGTRTYREQALLYAQGRTAPGKVVTNARPGQSAHNFGLAVDFCRDADVTREGLQPGWKLEDYEILAEEAEKLGLEAALRWKTFREGPHVQFPLAKKGLTLRMLHVIHEKGGMRAVWDFLDKHGPWFD